MLDLILFEAMHIAFAFLVVSVCIGLPLGAAWAFFHPPKFPRHRG